MWHKAGKNSASFSLLKKSEYMMLHLSIFCRILFTKIRFIRVLVVKDGEKWFTIGFLSEVIIRHLNMQQQLSGIFADNQIY